MKRNQSQLEKGEVFFLSHKLPPISDEAKSWANNPFSYTISYQKWGKRADKAHTYWCCSCGEEYCHDELTDLRPNPAYDYRSWSGRRTIATCPHCGKTMYIEDNWCRERTFKDMVAIKAKFGEWDIKRFISVECSTRRGEKESVIINEVGQSWRKGEGKTHYYFCPVGGMFYSKWWRYGEHSNFRNSLPDLADYHTTWDGQDTYEYPTDFSLDAELAKRGISTDNLHGMPLMSILDCMAQCPQFETLWKAGEYKMAKFFNKSLPRYWAQIKIARRQGYVIKDLIKWRDMIDMLREIRDINSPKYICPTDLDYAHDKAIEWKRRFDHKGELERNKVYDKELRKRIARYLNMDIHNEHIQIIVLPNVKAFMDEGDHLGHCVYRCGYYKKPESLILSARDADNMNKRWETIEINLNNFTIAQCYGYKDKFTERHKEITQLMNENMWQIRQRATA